MRRNSKGSTGSTGMDDEDYQDTRPSMSYLELEEGPLKSHLESKARPSNSHKKPRDFYQESKARPSDSYLDLEDNRQSKSYLELESRPRDSRSDEQATQPRDSILESNYARSSEYYLDLNSNPSSSYLDLHDAGRLSNGRSAKRGLPTTTTSQPTNGAIPKTNVYDIYYDDTICTKNKSALSNNPELQNGISYEHPSSSPNPLPLNGTGRQGHALPELPPETCAPRKLSNFSTNYNTLSRRTHFQGNTRDHETAIRELSKAGRGYHESSSSRCCCIRRRDVVCLVIGLLLTAACIAGCYYITHSVVSQLCGSNVQHMGDDAVTLMYGEVLFNNAADTKVFESRFKTDVENATKQTIMSLFLNNVTVIGFQTSATGIGRRICRFTMILKVDETKRKGLEHIVGHILGEKFFGQTPDGATLRCIVIATRNDAKTNACPEITTSQSQATTSQALQ